MNPAAAPLRRFFDALRQSPPLLWAFLFFFCLLSGYYVLRPVRDAMGASSDASAVFPVFLLDWASAPIPQAAWDALAALPHDMTDPEATRTYRAG